MSDVFEEKLAFYLNCYSVLPSLVLEDSSKVFRKESERKLFLLREVMFTAVSEWLAYLLQMRTEPPARLENERGIKAYAEQDRAWLDLLTEVRLRSEAQWMRSFGSALHLWFCTLFENEYAALQQIGLLKAQSTSFPGKKAWAIAQREELKFLMGDLSNSESGLSLDWFCDEQISLSKTVSATIIDLAEADIRFREKYYRPYLKVRSRCMSEIRDSTTMKAIFLDAKERVTFAAANNKRGRNIGFGKLNY
ncbi:MAG: hypothetical protein KME18_16680 [Phormidium tanganyikae FI6-MK23]|nr:hypothetical protein [Phormidium tanganyikae FI6-MK23]